MLFGSKKYSFNRQSATTAVAGFLQKSATAIATLDPSNKLVSEQIECAISELVNRDEDIILLVRRLQGMFEGNVTFVIIPKVNDKTLLIEGYSLTTMNSSGQPEVVVIKKDASELVDYMYTLVLAKDESMFNAFCSLVEKAIQTK